MPDGKKKSASTIPASEFDALFESTENSGNTLPAAEFDALFSDAPSQKKSPEVSVEPLDMPSPNLGGGSPAPAGNLPSQIQDIIDAGTGNTLLQRQFPQYNYQPQQAERPAVHKKSDNAIAVLTSDLVEEAKKLSLPQYQQNLSTIPFNKEGSVVFDVTNLQGNPQSTGEYAKNRLEQLRLEHQAELGRLAEDRQDPNYQANLSALNKSYNKKISEIRNAAEHVTSLQLANSEFQRPAPTKDPHKVSLFATFEEGDDNEYSHKPYREFNIEQRKKQAQELQNTKYNPLILGMRQQMLLGDKQAAKDWEEFNAGKKMNPQSKYNYEAQGYKILQEGASAALANGNEDAAKELYAHSENAMERLEKDNPEYVKNVKRYAIASHIYKTENPVLYGAFMSHPELSQKEMEEAAAAVGLSKSDIKDLKPSDIPRSAGLLNQTAQTALNTLLFLDEKDKLGHVFTGEVPQEQMDYRNPRGFLGHLFSGVGMMAGFGAQGKLLGKGLKNIEAFGDVAENAQRYDRAANLATLTAANYNSAYDESKKMFGEEREDEFKRQAYAIPNSIISTLIMEGMGGNPVTLGEKALGQSPAWKDYVKKVQQGGLDDLTKQEFQSTMQKVIEQIKTAGEHTVKMGGTMGAVEMSKNIANMVYDPQGQHGIMDNVGEAAISGAITMLLPSIAAGINAPKIQTSMNKALMYEVGAKPYEYKQAITDLFQKGQMSEAEANKANLAIDRMQYILQNQVPPDKINGEPLTDQERQDYAWNMLQNADLSERLQRAEQQQDQAQIDLIGSELNKLAKSRTDIISGKPMAPAKKFVLKNQTEEESVPRETTEPVTVVEKPAEEKISQEIKKDIPLESEVNVNNKTEKDVREINNLEEGSGRTELESSGQRTEASSEGEKDREKRDEAGSSGQLEPTDTEQKGGKGRKRNAPLSALEEVAKEEGHLVDEPAVEQEEQTVKQEAQEQPVNEPISFTTSKGSTYTINADGGTTRNKSARTEPGHEGTEGIQEPSQQTFYVSKEDMDAQLSKATVSGAGERTISKVSDDTIGVFENGELVEGTEVTFEKTPKKGLHPVEISEGKTPHFGNEIIELTTKSEPYATEKITEPEQRSVEPDNQPEHTRVEPQREEVETPQTDSGNLDKGSKREQQQKAETKVDQLQEGTQKKPLSEQIEQNKTAILHKQAELSRQRKLRDQAESDYNKALRSGNDAQQTTAAEAFKKAQTFVEKKERALAELEKTRDELTNRSEEAVSHETALAESQKEIDSLKRKRARMQSELDKLNARQEELGKYKVPDENLNSLNAKMIEQKEAELESNQSDIAEQQARIASLKNQVYKTQPLTDSQSNIFTANANRFSKLSHNEKESAYVKVKKSVEEAENRILQNEDNGVTMRDMPQEFIDAYRASKELLKTIESDDKFQKERSKSLADQIRSLKKEYKPGEAKVYGSIIPLPVETINRIGHKVWNGALEIMARAVEAGKSIREAVDAAIRHINDNAINEVHELSAQEEKDLRDAFGYNTPNPARITSQELRELKERKEPLSDRYRAEADKIVEDIKANNTSLAEALHDINSLRITDGVKQKLREYITWRAKEEIFKGDGEDIARQELSNAGGDHGKALAELRKNSEDQLLNATTDAEKRNIIDKTAAAEAYILKDKTKRDLSSGVITPDYERPVAQTDPNIFTPQKRWFKGNAYENLVDVLSAGEEAVQTPGAKIREGENFVTKRILQKSKVEDQIVKMRDYLGYDKERKDSFFGRLKADGVDLNKFGLYLYAKHAPERNAQNAKDREMAFDAKVEELTGKIANAETQAAKDRLQSQLDGILQQKDREYMLMPDGGSGMTNQQAADIIQEAKSDGMDAIYEQYGNEFRDNVIKPALDVMFEGNLIDQETYDKLLGHYENYVPLRIGEEVYNRGELRDDQENRSIPQVLKRLFGIDDSKTKQEDVPTFADTKTSGRNLYRSKGAIQYGYMERNNPLMQAIHNFEVAVKKAEQNKADIAFANFWRDNPNPDYVDIQSARYDVTKDKEGNVTELKEDYSQQPKNGIPFYEDGKKKYLVVNDPGLHKMFEKLPRNVVVDMGNKVSSFIRAVNTMKSPYFIVRNALFDPQDAVGNLAINKGENPYILSQYRKNFTRSVKDMLTKPKESIAEWKEWEEDWKKHGGKISFFNPENFVKKVEDANKLYQNYNKVTPKKALKFIPERIGDLASWIENNTRIQVYRAAVEGRARKIAEEQNIPYDDALQKVDRDQAAVVSRNATVDFERKGKYGSWINAWKAFVNAGLQGNKNLISGLAKHPKQASLVLGGLAMAGMMQAEIGRMLGDCDEVTNPDCYQNIDEADKQKNWLFPKKMFGGTGYIKVPIGRTFGWFNYLGVKADELLHGEIDGGKFMGETMGSLLDYYNPTGGTKEPIEQRIAGNLAPFEAFHQNTNIFGAPIAPEAQPGQFQSDAYFPTTPEGWVDAAHVIHNITGGTTEEPGMLEISPNQLQFIYQNVFGGIGKFMSDVASVGSKLGTEEPLKPKEIPFVNQFNQVSNNSHLKSEYMDIVNKLQKGEVNDEERETILTRVMEINNTLMENGDISPIQNANRMMRIQKLIQGDVKQEVLREIKENQEESE